MEQGHVELGIIQQSLKAGRALPSRIANAPHLLPGLDLYYTAFLQLGTCRSVGMGLGPIPWTALNDYALRHGIDDEEFDIFVTLVRRLDAAFLGYQDEKRKKDPKSVK